MTFRNRSALAALINSDLIKEVCASDLRPAGCSSGVWFSDVPEFRALIGNEAAEELQSAVGDLDRTSLALKKCFTRMMNCEKKLFVDQLNMLVKRISEEGERKLVPAHY